MTRQMKMTPDDVEMAIAALEILAPDTEEAHSLVVEFEAEMRDVYDDMCEPGAVGDALVSADEDKWAILADGLDIIDPEDHDSANLAVDLSERVRGMIRGSEPGL